MGSVLGPSGSRAYSMTCGITGKVVVDWNPVKGCSGTLPSESSTNFHHSCCEFSMLEFKLEDFQSLIPVALTDLKVDFASFETLIPTLLAVPSATSFFDFTDLPPPTALLSRLAWIQVYRL